MALIVLCCWLILEISTIATSTSTKSSASQAINTGGFRLLHEHAKTYGFDVNAIFSSKSIAPVMFLTYAGAWTRTRSEILETFFHGMTYSQMGLEVGPLVANEDANATVKSVTAILANKMQLLPISKSYWNISFRVAHVRAIVNFGNDAVRRSINEKAFKKRYTKELIKPNVFDPKAKLLLLNNLNFKCTWAPKFDDTSSYDGEFYGFGKAAPVRMMVQKNEIFGYFRTESMSVLEIACKEGNLSMYLIMPDKSEELSQLYKLTGKLLEYVMDLAKETKMEEVQIPKFKIESTFDLKILMEDTGRSMFGENPDLRHMIPEPNSVKFSTAMQVASFEVNEQGTEAQVDTTMKLVKKIGRDRNRRNVNRGFNEVHTKTAEKSFKSKKPQKKFIADRPFIFVVVDKEVKDASVIGRYVTSEKSNSPLK